MLLDDTGTQRDRRHRGADAHRVVGQADQGVERLGQDGDTPKVGVGRVGRVRSGALEHDDLVVSRAADSLDRRVDLTDRRHAGRDDDRLARRGRKPDQRQVHDLRRCDLVAGDVEVLQECDSGRVERARERQDPQLVGQVEDGSVPLPRRVRLLVEVVQPAIRPELVPRGDPERRPVGVDGDRVGRVGLELDRVGTGLGHRPDDGQRRCQVTVVVARHLGDDERRLVGTDRATTDGDLPPAGVTAWLTHGVLAPAPREARSLCRL